MEKVQKQIIFFVIDFLLLVAMPAQAATLYFSPSSGLHAVGTTFSVSIYVSSADQAMNAASGIISFPSDRLEVTSLSKTGSIFTLWVQEPSFSNSAGTVNFEGIVLNPGFTGSNGKAITITFRTKAAGNAPLTFSSGSALANDGKGTNILASLGNAQFNLGGTAPTVPEAATPSVVSDTPSAPQISFTPEVTSPTHPDEQKWYSNNSPELNWQLPLDVIRLSYLLDQESTTNPTFVDTQLISQKQYTNLVDGIWYFHINFRNARTWSELAHRKILIDTAPPNSFEIRVDNEGDSTNSSPKILFETTDDLSGIDHYEVQIDDEEIKSLASGSLAAEIAIYEPERLSPGGHNVIVKAFDKAGNARASSVGLTAQGTLSPFLKFGRIAIDYLSIMVTLIALLGVAILALLYGWYQASEWRKRARKEVKEVSETVTAAFRALREEIQEQIDDLDKKPGLTSSEERVRDKLKDALSISEKFIRKEIEDVEKTLE